MAMNGWRTGRAVAAAGMLALVLAGCSDAQPGVVAYVGDTAITQRQLDDAVEGVSTNLQPGQTVSSEAVVNALVHGAIADQIAKANDIAISDGERDSLLKGSNLAPLLAIPKARPVVYGVADQQLVSQRLGAEKYLAAVQAEKVTLNPRFGVLDPGQKLIVTDQSGSLAKPVAPSPSPTS